MILMRLSRQNPHAAKFFSVLDRLKSRPNSVRMIRRSARRCSVGGERGRRNTGRANKGPNRARCSARRFRFAADRSRKMRRGGWRRIPFPCAGKTGAQLSPPRTHSQFVSARGGELRLEAPPRAEKIAAYLRLFKKRVFRAE